MVEEARGKFEPRYDPGESYLDKYKPQHTVDCKQVFVGSTTKSGKAARIEIQCVPHCPMRRKQK